MKTATIDQMLARLKPFEATLNETAIAFLQQHLYRRLYALAGKDRKVEEIVGSLLMALRAVAAGVPAGLAAVPGLADIESHVDELIGVVVESPVEIEQAKAHLEVARGASTK